MHRFLWEGVELDIIPFGDIAEENKLLWPPDREIIMSVDGFTEAYTHATMVAISSHCQVKFCSLPGLLLLKIFAWRDRGNGSSKDAIARQITSDRQEEIEILINDFWDGLNLTK